MRNRTKRTLNDLYVRGTPLRVTTPRETITIWLQKLDPVDHDTCVRKAKAARARERATLQDHDSEEYLEIADTVAEADRADLIKAIIAPERNKIVDSVRSEMEEGEDSEWAKDAYLDGLYQAWSDGLQDRYMEDPDDIEAQRVVNEFKRFKDELDAVLEPKLADLAAQFDALDDEAVRAKAIEALIETRLGEVWFNEFVRSEVWLSSREACDECFAEIDEALRRQEAGEAQEAAENQHQEDHPVRHFANREAVDRLNPAIREQLEATYLQLAVDPTEGKGSPGNGASSGLSEESAPEETAPSSGPVAAPQ